MKQRIKKKAPDGYYSVEDIMKLMGVSRRQVFCYFSQYDDKLPKVQIKHNNYIPENILSDWLVKNTYISLEQRKIKFGYK